MYKCSAILTITVFHTNSNAAEYDDFPIAQIDVAENLPEQIVEFKRFYELVGDVQSLLVVQDPDWVGYATVHQRITETEQNYFRHMNNVLNSTVTEIWFENKNVIKTV